MDALKVGDEVFVVQYGYHPKLVPKMGLHKVVDVQDTQYGILFAVNGANGYFNMKTGKNADGFKSMAYASKQQFEDSLKRS